MVKKEGELWICEECFLAYKEKKWAVECEEWCKKYRTCNIEITKHAVGGIK